MSYDDLRHADRITIDGLEVFANHGVYPEENALGQKFIVSLVLYADLRAAGEHDNLDASIAYGSVCHDVDGYLREHTFKLIEAAAEGVAQMLLRRYPLLLGVRVKLDKPWAPVGLPLASCGVEIERVRYQVLIRLYGWQLEPQRQRSIVGAVPVEQGVKPLIVAWLEQVDELVGDNHVETLDGISGKFACDANGSGLGRA